MQFSTLDHAAMAEALRLAERGLTTGGGGGGGGWVIVLEG